MKISVLGAGNVGSLTAMRLVQLSLGDIVLVDIAKGLALGKTLDLEDSRPLLNLNYTISGTEDLSSISGSDIVVITAGFSRKPGMTREDLLLKNSQILKELSNNIKILAKDAIVIVVTNPLDLMTYLVFKTTGFKKNRVLGMGVSLDAARFANIISGEFKLPVSDIKAVVIGTHGEGMIPLPRHTTVKGISLLDFAGKEKTDSIINKTINRGAEIVAALGNGSAFFAPSAAITELVCSIVKNEKKISGVCAYMDGEYQINGLCIGVPCRIGQEGIEEIMRLDLNNAESKRLLESAGSIAKIIKDSPCMI